jgi:peptidylprolyl isomerase
MEKEKDHRPVILAAFALLAVVIVGVVLIGRSGGDDDGGGGGEDAAAVKEEIDERGKPKVTVEKGAPPKELVVNDLVDGTGKEAKSGDEVTVRYVGVNYKTGKEFDSSWSRNEPFPFTLGQGAVIPGWDQGVEGMKVGGRRELIIPPELGYGKAGSPPAIPPNETLVFVIDLEAVN